MNRITRIISVTLITAGIVILIDAGLTIVWKEPVSSVLASVRQGEAADQLDRLEDRFANEIDPAVVAGARGVRARAKALASAFEGEMRPGRGIGRLRIPAIDVDQIVVEGTGTDALTRGPGRYPETALPGQGRTVGIAGHRTTYGAPFHDIDALERDDEIVVEMPYANFTYSVEKSRIVTPDKVGVVRDIGRERLVLTACHPLFSAAQRYVIFAKLERVSLFGPLRHRWQDP